MKENNKKRSRIQYFLHKKSNRSNLINPKFSDKTMVFITIIMRILCVGYISGIEMKL